MPSQPFYEPEDLERWSAEDYLREMLEERAERVSGRRDAFPWMGPMPRANEICDSELEEEMA